MADYQQFKPNNCQTQEKSEAHRLEEVVEEGRAQLRRYLSYPEVVAQGDFVAYLWVVIGYTIERVEEVKIE